MMAVNSIPAYHLYHLSTVFKSPPLTLAHLLYSSPFPLSTKLGRDVTVKLAYWVLRFGGSMLKCPGTTSPLSRGNLKESDPSLWLIFSFPYLCLLEDLPERSRSPIYFHPLSRGQCRWNLPSHLLFVVRVDSSCFLYNKYGTQIGDAPS